MNYINKPSQSMIEIEMIAARRLAQLATLITGRSVNSLTDGEQMSVSRYWIGVNDQGVIVGLYEPGDLDIVLATTIVWQFSSSGQFSYYAGCSYGTNGEVANNVAVLI